MKAFHGLMGIAAGSLLLVGGLVGGASLQRHFSKLNLYLENDVIRANLLSAQIDLEVLNALRTNATGRAVAILETTMIMDASSVLFACERSSELSIKDPEIHETMMAIAGYSTRYGLLDRDSAPFRGTRAKFERYGFLHPSSGDELIQPQPNPRD